MNAGRRRRGLGGLSNIRRKRGLGGRISDARWIRIADEGTQGYLEIRPHNVDKVYNKHINSWLSLRARDRQARCQPTSERGSPRRAWSWNLGAEDRGFLVPQALNDPYMRQGRAQEAPARIRLHKPPKQGPADAEFKAASVGSRHVMDSTFATGSNMPRAYFISRGYCGLSFPLYSTGPCLFILHPSYQPSHSRWMALMSSA